MLKYMRNKLVSVGKMDDGTVVAHGILDDDIYSLWVDVSFRLPDLRIVDIKGDWNRWTTPECPRAVLFLKEAVGLSVNEEGFSQKVRKLVGRKACRHFANLLLECCHSVKETATVWEGQRAAGNALKSGEALQKDEKNAQGTQKVSRPIPREERNRPKAPGEEAGGGTLIDLHVHTSPASPCSSAPVEELIEEAKRIGLHGICLTDHNHVWDPEAVGELGSKHDFLILRGNEITTDQGDVIVFGLEREIKNIIKLGDLRKEVTAAGGVIILAHPFRGFLTFGVEQLGLTPEKAMERPLFREVDAVEVLNGKVTEEENRFAREVGTRCGLPLTGGSDAHEIQEVGVYATRFAEPIRNERELIEALKGGRFSPVVLRKKEGV